MASASVGSGMDFAALALRACDLAFALALAAADDAFAFAFALADALGFGVVLDFAEALALAFALPVPLGRPGFLGGLPVMSVSCSPGDRHFSVATASGFSFALLGSAFSVVSCASLLLLLLSGISFESSRGVKCCSLPLFDKPSGFSASRSFSAGSDFSASLAAAVGLFSSSSASQKLKTKEKVGIVAVLPNFL